MAARHLCEGKGLSFGQQFRVHSQQARPLRTIQVQTTRLIPVPNAQRNEAPPRQASASSSPKNSRPALVFRSCMTGNDASPMSAKPPVPEERFAASRLASRFEGADGHDQKASAGQQTDRRKAALATPCCAPHPERTNGHLTRRLCAPPRREQRRGQRQTGNQQQGARTEKGARGSGIPGPKRPSDDE